MDLQTLLNLSASRHNHLCPRQVLGVRLGLLAVKTFGLTAAANPGKRLLAILESDGCFADGVEVATGCTVGHRTLRLEDYGKVAATFIDTSNGRALRLAPRLDVRRKAVECLPGEERRYYAQLQAYQILPDEELISLQEVQLKRPLEQVLSRPGVRVVCEGCGEEIINEREVYREGMTLCKACAGEGYYTSVHNKVKPVDLLITDLLIESR